MLRCALHVPADVIILDPLSSPAPPRLANPRRGKSKLRDRVLTANHPLSHGAICTTSGVISAKWKQRILPRRAFRDGVTAVNEGAIRLNLIYELTRGRRLSASQNSVPFAHAAVLLFRFCFDRMVPPRSVKYDAMGKSNRSYESHSRFHQLTRAHVCIRANIGSQQPPLLLGIGKKLLFRWRRKKMSE